MTKYNLDINGIEIFQGFSSADKKTLSKYFSDKLYGLLRIKKKPPIKDYHKWFKKHDIDHEKLMSAKNRHFIPPNYISKIFFGKHKIFYKFLKKKVGNYLIHDEGLGSLSFRLIRPHKFNDGYGLSKKSWGPGGKLYSVFIPISEIDELNSLGLVVDSHKKKYKKKLHHKSKFCKSEYRFSGDLKKIKIKRFALKSTQCIIFHHELLHCEEVDQNAKNTRFSVEIRFKKIEQ